MKPSSTSQPGDAGSSREGAAAASFVVKLNERELATVLAALTVWESIVAGDVTAAKIELARGEIATDGGRFEALGCREIDALREGKMNPPAPTPVWPSYTNEALERMADWDERASGDPHDVEKYTNEAFAEQVIYLTTKEREEFEADAGVTLEADVIPAGTFACLMRWLKEGGAL